MFNCILLTCSSLFLLVKACPIYITISLVGKGLQDASLEINWGPGCVNRPEWIGIFVEDPSTTKTHPLMRVTDIQNSTGKILTNVTIGKLQFPKGWSRNESNNVVTNYSKSKCLSYYVASFSNSELLAVECLKIQPNWMSKLEHIAQMPLKDIFIPGTHASGAFSSNYVKTRSIMARNYVIAQHFDVWTQLVFGIRYLDLSIGFKNVDKSDAYSTKNFWIVNENMFVNPLSNILKDVKRFVQLSQEVVIIHFSSFPIGFYKHPERHSGLLHVLYQEIGSIVYQRDESRKDSQKLHCYDVTLDSIRRTNKYLLILYPVEELPYPENESTMLCPSWKIFSTAFMNTSQALDYMSILFSKKNLSPVQDEGWIFHGIKSFEQSLNSEKLQTTKERAATMNTKVTNWLRGSWATNANIVAMDYFSSTNIIDEAINTNLHKAFYRANKNTFIKA